MKCQLVLVGMLFFPACGSGSSAGDASLADLAADLTGMDSGDDLTSVTDGKAADDGNTPCHCLPGRTCCSGKCVDVSNDIFNCGACGVVCQSPNRYCDGKQCAPPPCQPACTGNQICCTVTTTTTTLGCYEPVKETCPVSTCQACQ